MKGSIQTDLFLSRLTFSLFLTNGLVNLIADEGAKLFLVDPSHCCLRRDLVGSAGLYRHLLEAVAGGGRLAAASSHVVCLLFWAVRSEVFKLYAVVYTCQLVQINKRTLDSKLKFRLLYGKVRVASLIASGR